MDNAKSHVGDAGFINFDHDEGSIELPQEIDAVSVDHLTVALMAAKVRDRSLVVDFSNVIFMDSAGLSFILEARNRIAELGGELIIRRPQAQARHLLELTELDNFSIIYD